MTQENAIKTLIQAVELATTRGVFTLADTRALNEAIDVFVKKPEEKVEETKEETK